MADTQADFIGKIRSAYNQFTRAEKKVADYITEHPREMLFMSITELADACGVGGPASASATVGLGAIRSLRCSSPSACGIPTGEAGGPYRGDSARG